MFWLSAKKSVRHLSRFWFSGIFSLLAYSIFLDTLFYFCVLSFKEVMTITVSSKQVKNLLIDEYHYSSLQFGSFELFYKVVILQLYGSLTLSNG